MTEAAERPTLGSRHETSGLADLRSIRFGEIASEGRTKNDQRYRCSTAVYGTGKHTGDLKAAKRPQREMETGIMCMLIIALSNECSIVNRRSCVLKFGLWLNSLVFRKQSSPDKWPVSALHNPSERLSSP